MGHSTGLDRDLMEFLIGPTLSYFDLQHHSITLEEECVATTEGPYFDC